MSRFRHMICGAAMLATLVIPAIAVTVVCLLPGAAMAQAAVLDDGGGGLFDGLLTTLEPRITELVALAMIGLAGLITRWVGRAFAGLPALIRQYFGLQAERIWREALHKAIRSGVLSTEGRDFSSGGQRLDAIVDYAMRSSPEAIDNLGASMDVLRSLAQAKIKELKTGPAPASG